MASLQDWFDDIGGWLRGFVELLFTLGIVLLVVDVIFATGFDIVGKVAGFVESFTGQGVTGLIVFLLILAIYRR